MAQDKPDHSLPRVGDLEIVQDLAFQRKTWKVQRAGWMVMAGLLVTALLGFFGQGALSGGTVANPSGSLRVEYERFGHWESTAILRIHVDSSAGVGGGTRIRLDQEYLSKVQIEAITPEPHSTETSAAAVTYLFRTPESDQQAVITVHAKMRRFGAFLVKVQAGDHPPVYFWQIIYP
ncbi:MAG: hypothetical protein ACREJU_05445 [Nitrospiraceae bacterium]